MSCQIRLTASLRDVKAIRRILFPTDDLRGSDTWLQLCEVSVAPTGDLIAIANERKLVILTAKWDSAISLTQYQITYSGQIHESDNVKAILCLPIVGQTHSSHVLPDWTCVLVGFESGYVRMYTENCDLLYEEQLHNESVYNIKCQSQHSPRPDVSPDLHLEEIYVQYQCNVCILPGNQLFPILRNFRSQLARVQAKGELLDIGPISLNLKKWGFQEQSIINDIAVVGLNLTNTFDHLQTASTCGGFDSKYQTTPPNNTLVLAAGSKPFLGFHFAVEGGAQPLFSDVAKAVAQKLKSALPGWLTGNRTPVEKQMTLAMQPVEYMGCRFGLCDLTRTAFDVTLSPDHKLAAVTDALGRVFLVDTRRGVALRVFKGYREAQCSFVQVPEERKSKHRIGNRVALFLVVYSPKRGTIDIFSTQLGAKITTFTASKFSRLFHLSYGLMGFATASKSRYVCQFTTILVDNDGSIKEFLIPFHFALAEKNNKRCKDIHLYKKIKTIIKSGELDYEKLEREVLNICRELRTVEIKTQLVDMLISSRDIPVQILLNSSAYFSENLNEDSDGDSCALLKIKVVNICLLLHFYTFVTEKNREKFDDTECHIDTNCLDPSKLNETLKNLDNFQKLLDLSTINDNKKPTETRVTFSDSVQFTICEFISAFELSKVENILVRRSLDHTILFNVSEKLFEKFVNEELKNSNEFVAEVRNSKISIRDLFYLLIYFWVNRNLNPGIDLQKEMFKLSKVVYALVKTLNPEEIFVDYADTSKFWSEVRESLVNSNRIFPALTAAIVCNYVVHELDHEFGNLDENIEVLSQESFEWSFVLGKLEDVSLLNILLAGKPVSSDCLLPKLHHDKTDISLKYILQRKGSVSELVARWLTSNGINPENLVLNDSICKIREDDQETEISKDKIDFIQSELVFQHLNLLKKQFPYSLEAGMILANMAWEYALEWKNDPENLSNLEACVVCLKVIPNFHVKQGLFNLIWNAHLKILFENSAKLLNKVGKLPKETFCRQDTGLSHVQLISFLSICTDYLDYFAGIVQEIYNVPKMPLNFEPIWEDGGQPLVELAVQQNFINFDLLQVHYQLALVLHMMSTFSIKHNKLLSTLFDPDITPAFFTDLQKKPDVDLSKCDSRTSKSRVNFLFKVISSSVEIITVDGNKIFSKDHVRWMSKVLWLGKDWGVNLDILKRFQVLELFVHGYNIMAEELVPAIGSAEDKLLLGSNLLAVAGRRTSQLVASSSNLGEKLSALSPTLTKYLDSLNGEWCAPSSLEDIIQLTTLSLSCLDDSQSEHKLALLLLEACSTLRDLQ